MNNNYPQNSYNRLADNQGNYNNQGYNPNGHMNSYNQYPQLPSPYNNQPQQYQNNYQQYPQNPQVHILPLMQPAVHPHYRSYRSKIKCFCIFGIVLCSLLLAFEIFSIFLVVLFFPLVLLTIGELITYCVFLCTKLTNATRQTVKSVRSVFIGFSVAWLIILSVGAIILYNTVEDGRYIRRSDILLFYVIPSLIYIMPRFILIGSLRVDPA